MSEASTETLQTKTYCHTGPWPAWDTRGAKSFLRVAQTF